MIWRCPTHQGPLDATADGLSCRDCGRAWSIDDGIVRFSGDTGGSANEGDRLDRLLQSVRRVPFREAVSAFCEEYGCGWSPTGADWKSLYAVARGATMLEIGPGLGDDTVELARIGPVACLTHDGTVASILHRRLVEAGVEGVSIAVAGRLETLPLASASIGGVAFDMAAAAAFGVDGRSFEQLAAELSRVVEPGGVVFLGVSNPLDRVFGPLRARLQAKISPPKLNAVLRSERTPSGDGPRPGNVIGAMQRHGFSVPVVYAPLPDERAPQVIIPVDEPAVVRYFLDNLIRKNSLAVRAAIRMAHVAVRMGLFRHLVPYRYLFFRRAGATESEQGGR